MSVAIVIGVALVCATCVGCASLWRWTLLDLHSSKTAECELKASWVRFEQRIDKQAQMRREDFDKKWAELAADVQQLKAREGLSGLSKR